MSNVFYAEIVDRGYWLLSDFLVIPAGTTTEERYELGAKPLIDGLSIAVQSLHCFYGNTDEDDLNRFRESYTLEFYIGFKSFYRIPLLALPEEGSILPPPEHPAEWIPQPGELTIERVIPACCSWGFRLIGTSFRVGDLGHGVRVLPVANGIIDRQVQ